MVWDQLYCDKEYVYGTEANDFLREYASKLHPGAALCLAEGEGRNAVWLAEQGFTVTAVDASSVGLKKANRLSEMLSVKNKTIHTDLEHLTNQTNQWDLSVSIFAHTPPKLRNRIQKQIVNNLKKNGIFLLEAYTPAQLKYKTGGPPTVELMMDLETLKAELQGLELLHAIEIVRDVHEGKLHHGKGAVVQVVARKT